MLMDPLSPNVAALTEERHQRPRSLRLPVRHENQLAHRSENEVSSVKLFYSSLIMCLFSCYRTVYQPLSLPGV
jgi:DNA-binding helix-hairpin-helix protein with protein kinase domain